MMADRLFEDTIGIINRWKPSKRYRTENRYRDELMQVLREEFDNRKSNFSFSSTLKIIVRKETGKEFSDIAINRRRIGIELKKDLNTNSQVNTLSGQLIGYKKEYDDIIVVLVGKTDREKLEYCKEKLSALTDRNAHYSLNREPRIKLINKG
jgi:hypothetical protein